MTAAPVPSIIPAKREESLSAKVVNELCGFPVQVYECPNCHLVELYRES